MEAKTHLIPGFPGKSTFQKHCDEPLATMFVSQRIVFFLVIAIAYTCVLCAYMHMLRYYTHTYIYMEINIYIYVYIYMCIYICIYIYYCCVYICKNKYVNAICIYYTYNWLYVHIIYIYIYMYQYNCMYTRIITNKLSPPMFSGSPLPPLLPAHAAAPERRSAPAIPRRCGRTTGRQKHWSWSWSWAGASIICTWETMTTLRSLPSLSTMAIPACL